VSTLSRRVPKPLLPIDTVPKLYEIKHRSMRLRRIAIEATLSETLSSIRGDTMRCAFEIKLGVDIDVNDDKLRLAFIDMVKQTARNMYGPTVMLAKNAPTISVSLTTRSGKQDIPLFVDAQASEDDDESD
jgi:hypothetical protein